MTAILLTDEPIAGWLLIQVQRVWSIGMSPEWLCQMMRLADGAVVSYQSQAGIKQAYEGCARMTREQDMGEWK